MRSEPALIGRQAASDCWGHLGRWLQWAARLGPLGATISADGLDMEAGIRQSAIIVPFTLRWPPAVSI